MLNKWALCAMAFLSISGGPIGMESAMINSNIWAIQYICLWILITYMIPVCYMCYEMTLKYDLNGANGGPMGWVYKSLGRRWGIANGIWDILDTLIDNSIYPVIFADNCLKMGYIPLEYKNFVAWGMIIITFVINYGEFQGIAAIFLCIFIMLPFVFGIFVTPWNNMYTETNNKIDWPSVQKSFTIIVWSINGFDMISPYAHKVLNPSEAYKITYIFNSVGTYLMMVIVYSMGTYYIHDPQQWIDGSFVNMAGYAAGDWGRWWMGISICAAAFGVLTAELCSTSYLFVALSKMGFSKRFESPRFNLLLNVFILAACVLVNLDVLIELSAFLNTLTLQCEVISYALTFPATKLRMAFVISITFNNIAILACLKNTCLIALGTSIGLALLCVWITEKSINVKKDLITD